MAPPPTSHCERAPGACASRLVRPLRLVGKVSSVSLVNCVVALVDDTSTTGDCPDTATPDARPRLMSTVAIRNPTCQRALLFAMYASINTGQTTLDRPLPIDYEKFSENSRSILQSLAK